MYALHRPRRKKGSGLVWTGLQSASGRAKESVARAVARGRLALVRVAAVVERLRKAAHEHHALRTGARAGRGAGAERVVKGRHGGVSCAAGG